MHPTGLPASGNIPEINHKVHNITLVITGWLISTNKTVLSLHSRLAKKCVYAAIVQYGIGIAAVIRSTIIKILMFI